MSRRWLYLCFALFLAALFVPRAHASTDRVSFMRDIEVNDTEEADDTVCFLCSIRVNGKVNGDAVAFLGSIHVNGEINGSTVSFLGDVAMGMLGPPGKKSMTLVGDTVNVAARLCSRARAGEVLLSCTVAAALELDGGSREMHVGPIPVLHLPQFALRGRSTPLDIWCVPAVERLAF